MTCMIKTYPDKAVVMKLHAGIFLTFGLLVSIAFLTQGPGKKSARRSMYYITHSSKTQYFVYVVPISGRLKVIVG